VGVEAGRNVTFPRAHGFAERVEIFAASRSDRLKDAIGLCSA
jgi:hypothetical protein